eukprot:COSAG05_NODE_843_length_7016_cov_3.956339_5_plen_98_part_00
MQRLRHYSGSAKVMPAIHTLTENREFQVANDWPRVALRTSEEELGHRMEADYWQKQHNMDLTLKDQRMANRYEAYDVGRAADEETVCHYLHLLCACC